MSLKKWLVIFGIFFCSCMLLLPRMVRVSDEDWARAESGSNLLNLGAALRCYHDVYGKLPPPIVLNKEGKPLYSWRVLLLPFIEENGLYQEFHLDEAWDSPGNTRFLEKMPRVYRATAEFRPGLTHFQTFVGPGSAFEREGLTWSDFPDGVANTILIVDAHDPVPWAKPADIDYDPQSPIPPFGRYVHSPVYFLGFHSYDKRGFNALFADGTLRFMRKGKDPESIRGFITRNGGETLDWTNIE